MAAEDHILDIFDEDEFFDFMADDVRERRFRLKEISKMDIAEKNKLIKHMLSELEAPSKPLDAWQTNFFESVADQFNRRGTLSDKQFETLERIYAEKTS